MTIKTPNLDPLVVLTAANGNFASNNISSDSFIVTPSMGVLVKVVRTATAPAIEIAMQIWNINNEQWYTVQGGVVNDEPMVWPADELGWTVSGNYAISLNGFLNKVGTGARTFSDFPFPLAKFIASRVGGADDALASIRLDICRSDPGVK